MYIKRGRLKEGIGRVLNKGRLLSGWGESNKYKLKIIGGGGVYLGEGIYNIIYVIFHVSTGVFTQPPL